MKVKLVKVASLSRWGVRVNEEDSNSNIKEFWFKRNAVKFAKKVSLLDWPREHQYDFVFSLRSKQYLYENGEEVK